MLSLLLAAAVATSSPAPAITVVDAKTAELRICAMSFVSDMMSDDPSRHLFLDHLLIHMPADAQTKIRNDCEFFANGAAFQILFAIDQKQREEADSVSDLPESTATSLSHTR